MNAADSITWLSRGASTLVVALIAYGVARRRRPEVHMPVMKTCFAIDVANVVVIELSRLLGEGGKGAVQKSYEELAEGRFTVLDVHVIASVASIACYAAALWSGQRLYKTGAGRKFHRWNAGFFLTARLVNYVTSFWV